MVWGLGVQCLGLALYFILISLSQLVLHYYCEEEKDLVCVLFKGSFKGVSGGSCTDVEVVYAGE